jgi:hypothetical protein
VLNALGLSFPTFKWFSHSTDSSRITPVFVVVVFIFLFFTSGLVALEWTDELARGWMSETV